MILTNNGRYAIIATIEIANYQLSFSENFANNANNSQDVKIIANKGNNIAILKLADIAKNNQIPLSSLEQIFSKLRTADIVKAIKGPGGGYVFSRSLEKISLADILIAVGEKMKTASCHSANNCSKDFLNRINQDSRCKTQHLWQGLERQINSYFSAISLQDICTNRQIINQKQPINNILSEDKYC